MTTTAKPELKPCPFCRSKSVRVQSDSSNVHFVECNDCEARGGWDITKELAIECWNDRTP